MLASAVGKRLRFDQQALALVSFPRAAEPHDNG